MESYLRCTGELKIAIAISAMYECVGLTSGSSLLLSVLSELSGGDSVRLNVVDDS